MNKIRLGVIAMIMLIVSCSDDKDPVPKFETELSEITTFSGGGITVTLYASESFFVGFNKITAKIADDNDNLLNGNISVTPMMDMMEMDHSAPLELPEGNTFSDGKFEFNTVFVMPSGEMGSWTLNFDVNDTKIEVPVTVSQPEYARMVSFVSAMDETTKYFVSLVEPGAPQVGQNDMELAIFEKESMMAWPPVTDLEIEMEPWMVSMDHGSPNNVSPVHDSGGHYLGTVNFTMTGDWQIRLVIKQGGMVCGEPYFDLFFQ